MANLFSELNFNISDRRYMFDETGQRTYENACQKYNVLMSRSFYKQLPSAEIIKMRHYGAGPRGAKAIAIPMVVGRPTNTGYCDP